MDPSEKFKIMQEAQSFFIASINAVIDGNLSQLKSLISSFLSSSQVTHPSISITDIFQEFHSEGRTLLHVAASNGKYDILKYIIDNNDSNKLEFINKADHNGMTPIILATIAESKESMTLLIENGANVNILNKDNAGCVHFAAGDGSVERLSILKEAGADFSVRSGSGTPLNWAAGKGRVDAVQYLISIKIDVNGDSNSTPPIIMAAVAFSDLCVCELLDAGAKFDYILSGNLTLLHICAENGLIQSVKKIIATSVGMALNAVATDDGNHPIHLAAMSLHSDIIALLLPISSQYVSSSSIDDILADGANRLSDWHKKHQPEPQDKTSMLRELEPTTPPKSDEDAKIAENHKQIGNQHFTAKNYSLAIEEYSKAIKLHGNSPSLWSNRSASYDALKDYKNALLDAEVCRQLDPSWAKGCYRLAKARLGLGLYEDAAVAAFEGCKLDNENQELKKILKEAVRLGQEEHKLKTKS